MNQTRYPVHMTLPSNALNDFVKGVTVYQGKPGKIDRSLIYIAAGASAWLCLLGVFGVLVDPVTFGPAWEEDRWFYIREQVNALVAVYHQLWFILLGAGAASGIAAAVLSRIRSGKWSRRLCGFLPLTAAILTIPLVLAACGFVLYALVVITAFVVLIALVIVLVVSLLNAL